MGKTCLKAILEVLDVVIISIGFWSMLEVRPPAGPLKKT